MARMDRWLQAACVLALLVVGSANDALSVGRRDLLAQKPATGALHAVAVIGSTVYGGSARPLATGNYLITNGNGTWTYSYYSNNGNLNGNDAGMGGDLAFPSMNSAWFNANSAAGLEVGLAGLLIPATSVGTASTSSQTLGIQTINFAANHNIPTTSGTLIFYGSGLSAIGITTGVPYSLTSVPSVTSVTIVNPAGITLNPITLPSFFAVFYANSPPRLGAVAVGDNSFQSPLALFTTGINSVTFTSSKCGIAVGSFGASFAMGASNSPTYIGSTNAESALSILLTYDGAASWVRATAVPEASSLIGASVPFTTGNAGTAQTVAPAPVVTPNDLTSVFFASKSMGWAVGGNDISLAGVTALTATQPQGAVYMTNNGGSVWKLVPTFVSGASLTSLWRNNDASLKNIFSSPVPGILFSVSSDASGKHVYAVGSPGTTQQVSSSVAISGNSAAATTVVTKAYATVVYSGNSGMSWVQQTAPTLYGGTRAYSLFAVAVQKGTTAVAVGGSTAATYGNNAAGTIICTSNGGFSWTQAVYPGSSGSGVPALTSVALQPSMNSGIQQVWVGGFTSRSDQSTIPLAAVSAIVTLTVTAVGAVTTQVASFTVTSQTVALMVGDVLTATSTGATTTIAVADTITVTGVSRASSVVTVIGTLTSVTTRTAGVDASAISFTVARPIGSSRSFYPIAAVTGFVVSTAPATVVSSGVPATAGSIYTVLVSRDMGRTFAAAPPAGFPTGFVVTSLTNPSSLLADRSVYGITWDNSMHGWIFGFGFIISTQNGGVSWVYETPADVGVLSVTPMVKAVASVPTSY